MVSIAINSQTPPIRFKLTYRDILEKYGEMRLPISINELSEDDYSFTVGGVSKMMTSLLIKGNFKLKKWISLGPGYPPSIKLSDIEIEFIDLDADVLRDYTRFKEGIYNEAHGVGKYNIIPKEYIAYAKYNWISAEKLLEFYQDIDIYLINDFQQLLVGGIIGSSAPAILWYHIPFIPNILSERVRGFLVRSFESFDAVIVSTKRDLEGLIKIGAKVRVKQIYPYIDPSFLHKPSKGEINGVREKFGLKDDDSVILLVARLDPIKSQDIAIRAIKDIGAKLLIVGNGSFTSTSLGHDKSSNWVLKLRALAKELNVESKVIFTGYVDERTLASLYEIADVILLTSKTEGFGLTAIEGWSYSKPVVVSSGAGVSELVIDGVNGYTFKNERELPEKLNLALKEREKLGSMGRETARKCYIENAMNEMSALFEEVMKEYGK